MERIFKCARSSVFGEFQLSGKKKKGKHVWTEGRACETREATTEVPQRNPFIAAELHTRFGRHMSCLTVSATMREELKLSKYRRTLPDKLRAADSFGQTESNSCTGCQQIVSGIPSFQNTYCITLYHSPQLPYCCCCGCRCLTLSFTHPLPRSPNRGDKLRTPCKASVRERAPTRWPTTTAVGPDRTAVFLFAGGMRLQ